MAAYKTQSAQLHDTTTYPTFSSTPTYQTQQAETTTSPLNNMAFSAPPSSGQYLGATSPTSATPVNILSCGPTAGTAGTRVELKVSSQYDLMAMSPPAPYVWLSFGSQKCHADVVKETVSQDGLTYIVSAEAPQFMTTNCASPADVPLTVVIENTTGEELARVPVARSFTYHNVPSTAAVAAAPTLDGTAPNTSAPSAAAEGITVTGKSAPGSPPGHGHIDGHSGGSPPQLAVRTAGTDSPGQTQNQLPVDSNNASAFSYPVAGVDATTAAAAAAAVAQQQAQVQNNFAVAAAAAATSYNQDASSSSNNSNSNMLGAYRSASFSDGYSRSAGHQPIRTAGAGDAPPTWHTPSYGGIGHQGSHHLQQQQQQQHNPHDRYGMGRSHSIAHVHGTSSITRPPLSAPLPAPTHVSVPQLIRTSTIQSNAPGSVGGMGSGNSYGGGHWGACAYPTKAVLTIQGNLDSMAQDWTQEEWQNRRRIVLFRKKQSGSHLETTFRPVPINERPPNSICISCIYWAEKNDCFVTSVDTINLLEQLVAAPARFTVEEKNRIRRNLEGFKPFTVSKGKAESEEFFKLIMAFGAPKPRTIEKDVKVFPWKILGQALKKIISKYSASPASMPPSSSGGPAGGQGHHMLTPVTLSPSYPVLPPTPGSLTTGADGTSAVNYVSMANGTSGAESLASPRSLSGASWVSYAGNATGRALSPGSGGQKPPSPGSTQLRLGGMAASYDTRGSAGSSGAGAHAYGHHQHHAPTFNSPLSMPSSTGASSANAASSAAGPPTHRWDNYSVASGSAPGSYGSSHHHHQHHHQSQQQQQQAQHSHHGHLYGSGYGESVPRT